MHRLKKGDLVKLDFEEFMDTIVISQHMAYQMIRKHAGKPPWKITLEISPGLVNIEGSRAFWSARRFKKILPSTNERNQECLLKKRKNNG